METKELEIRGIPRRQLTAPSRFNTFSVLCAAVLLLLISINTVRQSEDALDTNVRSKLETVLRIESEAVRQWRRSQRRFIAYLASDPELVEMASATQWNGNRDLKLDWREFNERLGEKSCLITTVDGARISCSGDQWDNVSPNCLKETFCATYSNHQPTNSKIFRCAQVENGCQKYWCFTVAPILHEERGIVGFIAVGSDLTGELSRVLRSSRSGNSGEVIAVSEDGQLVSESRFDHHAGVLEFFDDVHKHHVQLKCSATILNLQGQIDHRGVSVATASRWLPDLGFGLVAKMDVAESHAPVAQLRRFVWTLFGLLLLTTISTLVYRYYVYRLRQLAKEAELGSKKLGAYVLEDKIGEGGMGVVHKAKHSLLKRPTAIKILPPEKSSSEAISRFEREVQLTSQLKHPNTISIFDYGRTDEGIFYYAMELLDGMNLDQLVKIDGRVGDGRVVNILSQIAESLQEAHRMGLVHRDIKPANIMLCNRGGAVDTVKVLDFGMVREIDGRDEQKFGNLSGTPTYMAPELFENRPQIDVRSDIFAVGAVGFFLLTGRPLFSVNSFAELVRLHRKDLRRFARSKIADLASESGGFVSAKLADLICSCLANSMSDRTASVEHFLKQLKQCKPSNPWGQESAVSWWANLDSENDAVSRAERSSDVVENLSLDTTQAYVAKVHAGVWGKDRLVQC